MTKHLSLALALALAALGLVAVGCGSSFRVAHRTSIDPAANTHRTYAVVESPVNQGELDDLVQTSMHDVMAARGYTRAETPEQADVLVSYGVLLTDPRNPDQPMQSSDLSTRPDAPVRTKTLVVMLHDASTRAVIWMGVSTSSAIDSELRDHAEQILVDLRDRIPQANAG